MPKNQGVIYAVNGHQTYLSLLSQSIYYLRKVEPELPTIVFASPSLHPQVEKIAEKFGCEVASISEGVGFRGKIEAISKSPFDNTIYLDADTVPLRPFAEDGFRSLSYFDLVALPGMDLNHDWEADYGVATSQWNTGVLILNQERCQTAIGLWLEHFLQVQREVAHDQPSFRRAVISKNLKVGPLSPAFNFMGNGFVARPRILHVTTPARRQEWYQAERERVAVFESLSNSEPGFFRGFRMHRPKRSRLRRLIQGGGGFFRP